MGRLLCAKHLVLFLSCLAVALFIFGYPLYVIRPFRHQGPSELSVALAILRVRPWVEAICASAAIATLVTYWRSRPSRWRTIAALGAVAATVLFAGLSFINVYEVMFHPVGNPAFEPAGESKLAAGEMVLAIQAGGAARAYPIRAISYHHIVNDEVGGVPIVATY
jgi:hypothetical protein